MLKKLLRNTILLLLITATIVSAATTLQLEVGTLTSVLTTEMNTLGSNAYTAASAAIDNRIGQTLGGRLICRVIVHAVYGTVPTQGGSITGWFLKNMDPTTPLYETTPNGTIILNRLPDFVIPTMSGTGATTSDVSVDVRCPAERFKVVIQNAGTGQAMNASGNTLKILPITLQGN